LVPTPKHLFTRAKNVPPSIEPVPQAVPSFLRINAEILFLNSDSASACTSQASCGGS